ncbi:MAG: hypothetical protein LAO03_07720 [Acidobacteriia bacterium]|nr:hypothetical protein [Terriglobia bacterium]
MNSPRAYVCVICGELREGAEPWFLIANNRWQDKLRILQWNERLATQRGIHHACTAEHVQELVVHWMITGSLDSPFARAPRLGQPSHGKRLLHAAAEAKDADVDTSGARQIGELAVDRESMQRVLDENPHSLTAILEALLGALRRSTSLPCKPDTESRDERLVVQEV